MDVERSQPSTNSCPRLIDQALACYVHDLFMWTWYMCRHGMMPLPNAFIVNNDAVSTNSKHCPLLFFVLVYFCLLIPLLLRQA
jgi:hypothetical protein